MTGQVTVTVAAELMQRSTWQVRQLYKRGQLTGSMQLTVTGKPSRLLIDKTSIDARLARERQTPLTRARKGLAA